MAAIPSIVDDLVTSSEEAAQKISTAQSKQKKYFDKRQKAPNRYKEGDLVLIEQNPAATGTSRKLVGPMIVTAILPNDRYRIDMPSTCRTAKRSQQERAVAVDRMKPWCPPGGMSDTTDSESGEDGVVVLSPGGDGSSSDE